MILSPQFLAQKLAELTYDAATAGRLWVAFSGGVDSAVLLHLASGMKDGPAIRAVHVDHGLDPQSGDWAQRARAFAAGLDVIFVAMQATVEESGAGLEAAARESRYRAFESVLEPGDWLLSAHHEEDQAETLLLHLLRGSGVLGLAGIAAVRDCGDGRMARPLLDVGREEILDYAARHDLNWTEDPSNRDHRFDRNYLRHAVMPVLRERWPASARRLRKSAELAGEASQLQDALAAIDLASAGPPDRLDIAALKRLDIIRRRNLLRYALRAQKLATPPAGRLGQIVSELVTARDDAQPHVCWDGAEARRYRGQIFLMAHLPSLQPAGVLKPGAAVSLGEGMGELRLEKSRGRGIAAVLAEAGLEICERRGGERLRPSASGATRMLKTLLQEEGILPWMRNRLPLLTHDGQLVAVADRWVDEAACASGGYVVCWDEPPTLR